MGDQRAARASATQEAPAAPQSVPTKLAAHRGQVARGEYVELPELGRVYMRLLGRTATTAIEAAVFDSLAKQGIPALTIHAFTYDQERKVRTLAVAARDPDDHGQPFGTLQDWLEEDDDIIFYAGLVLDDVKARLDPVGLGEINEQTEAELLDAFKKKETTRLMLCGVATLARWLTSGAVQLSSSPTPSSSTSPSSAE